MKSLLIAILLSSVSAFAGEVAAEPTAAPSTKLNCQVPNDQGASVVALEISKAADTSVDFVTFTLTSPNVKAVTLFTQMEPGTYEKQISGGQLGTLVLQENAAQENGVVKNAGFIVLNKEADGTFSGMMAALSNIYPLTCSVNK
jgi:hypothetical protein